MNPSISIVNKNTPKVRLEDLITICIDSFDDKEFSLHDLTNSCREKESSYDITDCLEQTDPINGRKVQWIEHGRVKSTALPLLRHMKYEERDAGQYRLFKKPQSNNSNQKKNASANQSPPNYSLLEKMAKYVKSRCQKKSPPTLKQIQSRFKRNPMTCAEIEKLCLQKKTQYHS